MRRGPIAFAVAGLAAAATLVYYFLSPTNDAEPPKPSALVIVASAVERPLAPEVAAYGTVGADPNFATTVSMPRDGIVTSIAVRVGDQVVKGATLMTIESSAGATAQFAQAQSNAKFTAKDLAHTRELYRDRLATRSQLDAAVKADLDAQATLAQEHTIGADQHGQALSATIGGVVTSISATLRQHIAADTAIFTIGTRDRLVVNVGVEPNRAASISAGASVALQTAEAAHGVSGDVLSVSSMVNPDTRLVDVAVRVPPETAAKLILGTTLLARIALPARQGIVVPRAAVLADEKGTYVIIVEKNLARRRDVTIAFETDRESLISAGLAKGDVVVTDGNVGLEDGLAVRTK